MEPKKNLKHNLQKLLLAFCLFNLAFSFVFSGVFQISFSNIYNIQVSAEENDADNNNAGENNTGGDQTESDTPSNPPTAENTAGFNIQNLQTFANCNFSEVTNSSSNQGMQAVIECLRSVLNFIIIISIITGFFRIVFVAFQAFTPGATDSANPLVEFKSRLLDFLIGIPFMGASVLLLFILNPAATNVNFLDLQGLSRIIPQAPTVSRVDQTSQGSTGGDNTGNNIDISDANLNRPDRPNTTVSDRSSIINGLSRASCSRNSNGMYDCSFTVQQGYELPSSGFEAGISINTNTKPANSVSCNNTPNGLECNGIDTGNQTGRRSVLLTFANNTYIKGEVDIPTPSSTNPDIINPFSTDNTIEAITFASGPPEEIFGCVEWSDFFHLERVCLRHEPYTCQNLTFTYRIYDPENPDAFLSTSPNTARIRVCDNPALENHWENFRPLVERDGEGFKIATYRRIPTSTFNIDPDSSIVETGIDISNLFPDLNFIW